MSEKIIGNHCTFKCNNCNKTFSCYYGFKWHGKIGKKPCVKPNFNNLPKYIKEIIVHKCKICSKVILCSRQMIREHLRGHKMTLPEYAQRTGCVIEDTRGNPA